VKHVKNPRERQEARERCQKANAAFTDAEVRRIRADCDEGKASYVEIAQAWGCGMQTVRKMHRRETYTWVKDAEGEEVEGKTIPEYKVDGIRDSLEAEAARKSAERFQERFGPTGMGKGETARNMTISPEIRARGAAMLGHGPTAQDIAESAAEFADRADAAVIAGLPRAPLVDEEGI